MPIETQSTTAIQGCRTTRIYCRPDCPAGKRMKAENRVGFSSREEARTNGYRACKVCKPDGPEAGPETFFLRPYHSPLGLYILVSSARGVVCVATEDEVATRRARWNRDGIRTQDGGACDALADELDAYFARRLLRFSAPLDLRGTPFQRRVWELLRGIPYGATCSYRQIAEGVGRAKAARAVGRAIGSNPVAIIVPCHRVVGSTGGLTGYAGGLHRKRALLDHEAAVLGKG